jgi:hypothetical protein
MTDSHSMISIKNFFGSAKVGEMIGIKKGKVKVNF